MREIQLPDLTLARECTFSTQLGSRDYELMLAWSDCLNAWQLSVYELDGSEVFTSRLLAANSVYFPPIHTAKDWAIVTVSRSGEQPVRDNLGIGKVVQLCVSDQSSP
jgi:hypothetical protein